MVGIGTATNGIAPRPKAFGGTVAMLSLLLNVLAVKFNQHRAIHVTVEGFIHGRQIVGQSNAEVLR